MGIVVPDIACLREPNLLIPGKKPIGPVRVDQSALSQPCRWVVFPELKTGIPGAKTVPTFKQNSPISVSLDSKTISGEVTHNPNRGLYFNSVNVDLEFNADVSYESSDDWTLLIHGYSETPGSFYDFVLNLESGISIFLHYSGKWGLYHSTIISVSNLSYEEYILLVRRKSSSLNFFKNGKLETVTSSSTDSCTGSILVLNAYGPASGFGQIGTVASVAMFDGALLDEECNELTKDPYQFLIPA